MKKNIEEALKKAISYTSYRKLISDLIASGKSSGPIQSEDLLNYSKLNDRRMTRLDKTIQLSQETLLGLKKIDKPITCLVLTEGWCGDAAQTLPVISKVADESDLITLKIIFRDEHEQLMSQFLTNGGKSIPKLLVLNSQNKVLNTWGPRPNTATKMVQDYKNKYGQLDAAFKQQLQVWYNKDKGVNIQEDMLGLLTD
ncbi:thioredoxin family protein [Flavobacteriaceae bacterium]|nr:thioredoxin family protein [Flavobacteriaceae bacterium]